MPPARGGGGPVPGVFPARTSSEASLRDVGVEVKRSPRPRPHFVRLPDRLIRSTGAPGRPSQIFPGVDRPERADFGRTSPRAPRMPQSPETPAGPRQFPPPRRPGRAGGSVTGCARREVRSRREARGTGRTARRKRRESSPREKNTGHSMPRSPPRSTRPNRTTRITPKPSQVELYLDAHKPGLPGIKATDPLRGSSATARFHAVL
jgi:hypothetical protein